MRRDDQNTRIVHATKVMPKPSRGNRSGEHDVIEVRSVAITVVIPVRADLLLARAVSSVPGGSEIEIVIALTRPTPEVRAMAESCAARDPRVRLASTDRTGMSAGVNLGVLTASCDNIVILDSDCVLAPETLIAYARALESAPFVRGQTAVERAGGWSSFAGLGAEEMNRRFAVTPRLMGPSIAFSKRAFEALGGYDEACGASCDHEFALRLERAGVATTFAPDAWITHQPITFRIDTSAHRGYGKGMRYIDGKHGGRYGLGICLDRLHPVTLLRKLVRRGPSSVLRSLLLGTLMLIGYAEATSRAES
jgi:glycosyltransferase involved in cell wall biosynthesis